MIPFAKLGAGEIRPRVSGNLRDSDLGCIPAPQVCFGLASIRGVF